MLHVVQGLFESDGEAVLWPCRGSDMIAAVSQRDNAILLCS